MNIARVESKNVVKITIIQLLFSNNLVNSMQTHFNLNLFFRIKNQRLHTFRLELFVALVLYGLVVYQSMGAGYGYLCIILKKTLV
jgi:hypothetical protein